MTESQSPQERGRKSINCSIEVGALRHVSLGSEALTKPEAQQIGMVNGAVSDKYRQAAAIQLGA